jgi:endonuclease IV
MKYIINKININEFTPRIYIETQAGEKNDILSNLNDFFDFYNELKLLHKNMFSVCIDTCHIFQAG